MDYIHYPTRSEIKENLPYLRPSIYYYSCLNGQQIFVERNNRNKTYNLMSSIPYQTPKSFQLDKFKALDNYKNYRVLVTRKSLFDILILYYKYIHEVSDTIVSMLPMPQLQQELFQDRTKLETLQAESKIRKELGI